MRPAIQHARAETDAIPRTPAVQAAWDEMQAALAANRDRLERLRREIGEDVTPTPPEAA